MSISTYRAVSIGALGGVAAFLVEGPAAHYGAQLFPILIGWAGYYHFGGKIEGVKKALLHLLAGVVLAGVALALSSRLPYGETLGAPAWTAIAVAITLAVLVFASRLSALSDFAVAILGYATLFALAGVSDRGERIIALSQENPLAVAVLSLLAGVIFALLSDYLTEALQRYVPLRGQRPQSATSA